MSYYDYAESLAINARGHAFYALIMAAMRQADSTNSAKLRAAFPDVWQELDARYHAAGGVLPGDNLWMPAARRGAQPEDNCNE